jgi:hypothetical protein
MNNRPLSWTAFTFKILALRVMKLSLEDVTHNT